LFQKAATAVCENPTAANRDALKKREVAYKEDALSKGKKVADVNKTISAVKSCPKSATTKKK
jgi:hypothetical protein